jgi:hypothetical protein
MAGKLKFDPFLGRMRLRDVPTKAGTSGKFLHSDGVVNTLPDWDDAPGAGSGGDVYVRAYWFESVAGGTTGNLSAPTGGALVLDAWPDGVDALATELDAGGKPTWETPATAGGVAVTVALDADGDWTLSGTPASYPVGIVFCYRTQMDDLDDSKTLAETGLDWSDTLLGHTGDVDNPHQVTAAQVGAELDGTAASMVNGHAEETYGVHGITAAAATVLDDATIGAMRATLGVGARKLVFTFDGGGSALVGDSYVVDRLLWAFVANKTTIQVKPTGGTVTFEVFVDAFSTSSEPSTSVTNTNDPAIASGYAVEDADISNWSDLSWAAGRQIKVRIKNNTPTATWASLTIEGTI